MKALAIFAGLAIGGVAHAQSAGAPPAIEPNDVVNPVSIVEGAGVKVGEGTVLHPIVGIETGFIDNVFYQDADPTSAGLLRILAEIGTGSLSPERLDAANNNETTEDLGSFQYMARAYATWDQYLSTNDNVTSQGGLGGGLLFRGIANPGKPLTFGVYENFNRLIRATNFESRTDTNRDINTLALRLGYRPYGRSVSGYLEYVNVLDLFEQDNQQFADRLQNTLGLRVIYQWLPLTRVYAHVSQGIYTGVGSSTKVTSYPLDVYLGLQTALTVNTTLQAKVGYTAGFYQSGPSYSTIKGGAQFGYAYSPLGHVNLLYVYEHQDSINANFYRDHQFRLTFEQLLNPFSVFAGPELRLRRYEGITDVMGSSPDRDDVIFSAVAGVRYLYRKWLAATIDYRLTIDSTDFRYVVSAGMMDDPSYTRNELMIGLRAAY